MTKNLKMRVLKGIKQGTPEWLKVKLGVISGTRIKKIKSTTNMTLLDELCAERGSEYVEDSFTSDAMQRGKDMEPYAIKAYEKHTGFKVTAIGFGLHDKYDWWGISPDGFIMQHRKRKRAIEIKCPNTSTHFRYCRMGKLPTDYRHQVLNYFMCEPDCEAVDFISFDPRYKPKPLLIITTTREEVKDELIELEAEITAFWEKVIKEENKVLF